MRVTVDGVATEVDVERLLDEAQAKERSLLEQAKGGDALSAAKLLSQYVERDSLYDLTVEAVVDEGCKSVIRKVLAASTVPNRRHIAVQPLLFFGDSKAKPGPKASAGDGDVATQLIVLRVSKGELLTDADAEAALTTVWEGLTIGKGAAGEKLPRPYWKHTFAEVESQLVGYIGSMFKGASPGVCSVYARLSFSDRSWFPYTDPSQPIIYPANW